MEKLVRFVLHSIVSVDSGSMSQPCRTAGAIAILTKRSSGSDSVSTIFNSD